MKEESFLDGVSAIVKALVVLALLPSLLILIAIEKLFDMGEKSG